MIDRLRNLRENSIVEVVWLDSCSRDRWIDRNEAKKWALEVGSARHYSCGYLLSVTDLAVVLTQSRVRYDEEVASVDALMSIPCVAILDVTVLSDGE